MATVTVTGSDGGSVQNTATYPVTRPAGASDGDRLLASFTTRGSYTVSTVPTGWTLVDSQDAGAGTDPFLLVYAKDDALTSGDTGPWNFVVSSSTGGGGWSSVSYSGGDPTGFVSTPTDTGTGTSHNAGGVTVPGANDLVLAFFGSHHTGNVTWTPPSSPTTYTELQDNTNTGGSVRHSNEVSWDNPGAGATGTLTGTSSQSASGAAVVLAIPEAGTSARAAVVFGGRGGTPTVTPTRSARAAVVLTPRGGAGPAATNWPDAVRLEVAFDVAPDTEPAAADWVDISRFVRDSRGISIVRGRTGDLEEFSTGVLTVDLKNDDRRFEPGSTTYGATAIRPLRHVRVVSDYRREGAHDATSRTLFRGFARSWKPTYPHAGKQATVTLTALDAAWRLSRGELTADFETNLLALAPLGYWKLTETSGTTATDSGSGGTDGTYESTGVTLAAEGWDALDASRLHADFDGSTGGVDMGNTGGFGLTGAMTFCAWVKVNSVSGSDPDHYGHTIAEAADPTVNGVIAWSCTVRPDGNLMFRHGAERYVMSSIAGGDVDFSSSPGWRHLAFVRTAALEIRCYIDGQLTAVGAQDGSTGTPSAGGTTLRMGMKNHDGSSSLFLDGVIGDAALWNSALTAGDIAGIYDAQVYARPTETADVRIGAVLDAIGWPTELRALETGVGTLQTTTFTAGASALALMQRAARSELGAVFVAADGKVRFHDRLYRSLAEQQATFGDAAGELPFHDIALDYGATRITNTASVTRDGGTEQTAVDTASQAEYGQMGKHSVTVDVADDGEASTMADVILSRRGTPDLVADAVIVKPFDSAAFATLWPLVTRLDLGDRIAVNWRPDGGTGVATSSARLARWLELVTTPGFYYTLGDTAGDPVDSSGNGYTVDSTHGSTTYGHTGPFADATAIRNSTNQPLYLNDPTYSPDVSAAWTCGIWVKVEAATPDPTGDNGDIRLLSKEAWGSAGFRLVINLGATTNGGAKTVDLYDAATQTSAQWAPADGLELNRWYDLVGVYDGAGTLTLYVDGVAVATHSRTLVDSSGAWTVAGCAGWTGSGGGASATARTAHSWFAEEAMSADDIAELHRLGPITQDSFIERIEHTIRSREWITRYTLSPADRQVFWRLGASTLGDTTRLAWKG